MANVLPFEKKVMAVSLLAEGSSNAAPFAKIKEKKDLAFDHL